MAATNFVITVKMKWWLKFIYLPALSFINEFVVNYINVDASLNTDKVTAVFKKGLKFYCGGKRIY